MSESNMQKTHNPYTPTTEEVRNTFWLGQHSVSKTDWANSEAEFNKWLAEVKAKERKSEHERIIEAVKPGISKGYFPPEEVDAGDWLEIEFSEFVAIVKGETE